MKHNLLTSVILLGFTTLMHAAAKKPTPNLCPTLPSYHSYGAASWVYRRLVFKALKHIGYSKPSSVFVFHAHSARIKSDGGAMQITLNKEKHNAIFLDENLLNSYSHGVRRMIILHESCHLLNDQLHIHASDSKELERNVDQLSAYYAQCQCCMTSMAIQYLKENKSRYFTQPQYKPDLQLNDLYSMSDGQLNTLLKDAKRQSSLKKNDHPTELERAVTFFMLSKKPAYGNGKLCFGHANPKYPSQPFQKSLQLAS